MCLSSLHQKRWKGCCPRDVTHQFTPSITECSDSFLRQTYSDDRSAFPLCFFSTTIYHSQPVQPNPPQYYSKVGQALVQQPTLPLQASPRCPTAARAGGSQVVRVKGSEQQRDRRGRKEEKKRQLLFFYLLGTLPNCIDQLRNDHVHTFGARLFNLPNLPFHNGLKGHVRGEEASSARHREKQPQGRKTKGGGVGGKKEKRRNKEGWVERRVLIIKIYSPFLSFKQKQAKIQQKTGKGNELGCDPTQQIFSCCYIVLDQRVHRVTHISHIPTFYNQASQQVFYTVQGLTNVIEHLS